ncbi:MAG: hypothetical protein KA096_00030 [Bacteroidales bacterium]|nr:hypothetical protein [Bacteroidales bacterium]
MKYRLYYLDDDPNAQALADGFNSQGVIEVQVFRATSFSNQIIELKENEKSFQGLILDLKLDDNRKGERVADYTATSLAQNIRSKVIEGYWEKEFPIFLFTTYTNYTKLFLIDISGQDLFDKVFMKEDIGNIRIQNKIADIIRAYQIISENRSDYYHILNIKDISRLDQRIFPGPLVESSPVFNHAIYILNELVLRPGPLIDEFYLASRLGIDIEKSADWKFIKDEVLNESMYFGVFSNAWKRWWMFKINDWWKEIGNEQMLAGLDARERVGIINGKFGLNLVAADPIKKSASYRYWTICQALKRPLDPREGLRIFEKDPYPWQETRYISIEAALERIRFDEGIRVHPAERDRFNDLKEIFSK